MTTFLNETPLNTFQFQHCVFLLFARHFSIVIHRRKEELEELHDTNKGLTEELKELHRTHQEETRDQRTQVNVQCLSAQPTDTQCNLWKHTHYSALVTTALTGGIGLSTSEKEANLYGARRWTTQSFKIVDHSKSVQRKFNQFYLDSPILQQ